MGYIYLLCVALLFSFGGTCVKLISPYFDATYITFFRFAVGVLFLLLLKAMKRQPFQQHFGQVLKYSVGWILFGAVSKWLAYLTENYAIAHGTSYGNIVTQPAQTVFLTLASVLLFKEKLTFSKVLCILMCMGGVLCISWNGRPLDVFLGENIFLTILFWISGTLAGCHVLSQKMIADRMDVIDSNLSIFALSALFSCEYFKMKRLDVETRIELCCKEESFQCLLFLEGKGNILFAGERFAFQAGDCYFLPAGLGAYEVEGACMALFAHI